MARDIFAYILHKNGVADDTAFELATAAGKIDPEASVHALVFGAGPQLDAVCNEAASVFASVWKVGHEVLSYPNAEVIRKILPLILPAGCVVLIPHEHFGMDLAPGLSIKLNAAYAADVLDINGAQGDSITAVRQEFGGMAHTHVRCDMSGGIVVTTRPGAFKFSGVKSAQGQVIDKSREAFQGGALEVGRKFIEIVEAEVGDVDITKSEILVSVGRGIEDQENLEIVFNLAKRMGGDVSCSRPIVDAKWLEKSRQVGTSGKTVKPKVYLALGISGSFQHIGGIKGAPFIIAVNKNSKAPIFQVADVGVVSDILEFIPELTEKIEEMKG